MESTCTNDITEISSQEVGDSDTKDNNNVTDTATGTVQDDEESDTSSGSSGFLGFMGTVYNTVRTHIAPIAVEFVTNQVAPRALKVMKIVLQDMPFDLGYDSDDEWHDCKFEESEDEDEEHAEEFEDADDQLQVL